MLLTLTCTEDQLGDTDQVGSAGVEYHPSRSDNPQSKKVRVVGSSNNAQRKPASHSGQTQPARDRKQRSDPSRGKRPAWNSNVRHKTAPIAQSDRDPTYERRREQRLQRQRELLAQAAANDRLIPRRYVSRDRYQQNEEPDEREPERSRQRRRSSLHADPTHGPLLRYS